MAFYFMDWFKMMNIVDQLFNEINWCENYDWSILEIGGNVFLQTWDIIKVNKDEPCLLLYESSFFDSVNRIQEYVNSDLFEQRQYWLDTVEHHQRSNIIRLHKEWILRFLWRYWLNRRLVIFRLHLICLYGSW